MVNRISYSPENSIERRLASKNFKEMKRHRAINISRVEDVYYRNPQVGDSSHVTNQIYKNIYISNSIL